MIQKGQTGILILVGILIIAAVAGGAYYFGRQKGNAPTISKSSPSLSPALITHPSGQYAFDTLGDAAWVINADGSNKRKIASNVTIEWPDAWSPDNKHILIRDKDKIDQYAVVDLESGEVIQLPLTDKLGGIFTWFSNDEILRISNILSDTPGSIHGKLEKISIKDNSISNVATIPIGTNHLKFLVSPDLRWIIADNFPTESKGIGLFSYDTQTRKVTELGENSNDAVFVGWENGKIIYSTKNAVWEIASDGSNKKMLVNTGNLPIKNIKILHGNKKLFYSGFVYDFSTGISKKQELVDNFNGSEIFSVSKDANFGLSRHQGVCYVINLKTGEGVEFDNSGSYCYGSWSN